MTVRAASVAVAVVAALAAAAPSAVRAVQSERVPDAAVINGVPQGMFVGRSLLSGKAICLLFLSGGRITRAIPDGGLENFDWTRHRAAHAPDSGTWQTRGGQLVVTWGDGGVHQGLVTVHPDAIEFYGKRYSKPVVVELAALAGRWEATRGTAIAGGQGINRVSELVIRADGRYEWANTTGGVVAGRAVASDRSMTGQVTVKGLTIIFKSDAGTTSSHTLLPVAGQPVNAFSVDSDMFTRSGPAPAATLSVPPPASGPAPGSSNSSSHQGLAFTTPQGWRGGMQQGRLVLVPAAATPDTVVVLINGAADLGARSFDDWLRALMAAELTGFKVVQAAPATRGRSGALETLSAGRTVQDQSGTVVLQIYYAISDGRRAGAAMVATTTEAALRAQMPGVQALFQSLRFAAADAGDGKPSPPAPGAAGTSRTVSTADMVGTWEHSSSAHTQYSTSSGGAAGSTTTAYGQGYTFRSDGTYAYSFTGMMNSVYIREKDSGTWSFQGGHLVIRSKERTSTKSYQIVQFQAAPDGSATLTLLAASYPLTDSNINVWGERYVRKATSR